MALTLDVGANTRAAVRNVGDVGEALGEVADSLDDLARESQQSGTRVERAFDDAADAGTELGRDVERAGDKIERTFEAMVRDAKKADTAVEKVGDGGKRGFGKASEAVSEFKDEANSNLSEVVSSFDGSMSSVQDLVQGTLGGLAGSLPGLGVVAAGAAAGVGLIGAAFVAADEERQRFQDRANDLASAYINAGQQVLDAITISSRLGSVLTEDETRKQAEALVQTLGVDLPDAARIIAGDANALAAAYSLLDERQASLREQMSATSQVGEEQMIEFGRAEGGIAAARKELDKYSESNAKAREAADAYSQGLKDLISEAGTATEYVDDLGNKLVQLPEGETIFIDAKTGQASLNIDRFQGDVDKLRGRTVSISADTSSAYAAMDRFRRDAARGISISVIGKYDSGRSGRPFQ
ncbi:hypothetical protein ACIGEP_15520 [Microbacterium sp. NPDC077663]|uniref:hypothetical protein n=1 Tax=Microbacterium sp. NPDC077663 TaxID=3364189 RepID=UPI0037C9CD6A